MGSELHFVYIVAKCLQKNAKLYYHTAIYENVYTFTTRDIYYVANATLHDCFLTLQKM